MNDTLIILTISAVATISLLDTFLYIIIRSSCPNSKSNPWPLSGFYLAWKHRKR